MNLVRRVQTLEQRMVAMRTALATPAALDSPADVLALLEEQVNAVRADPLADPTERARTLGMLAGLALRAIHSRDLDARVEAVERVLKLRKDAERDNGRRSR
jgi:hypothetical protein